MRIVEPGSLTSSGYTSGSPSQPEPYTRCDRYVSPLPDPCEWALTPENRCVLERGHPGVHVPARQGWAGGWDELAGELATADVIGWGSYRADTGQPVLELWLDDSRHFRVFVADVVEVTE